MGDVKIAWSEVQNLRRRIDLMTKAAASGAGLRLSDIANTVLVIQACHVLQKGLSELCKKRGLKPKSRKLGALIETASAHITDIDMINKCRERRNKIAHGNLTLPRAECWKYFDAIEKELDGWGLLMNP